MSIQRPFDTAAYNALPGLCDSYNHFKAQNGSEVVATALRDLYIEYGLVDKFGTSLLHRHCGLKPNEALVDHNRTSSPWLVPASDEEGNPPNVYKKYNGTIRPLLWMLSSSEDGQHCLIPYEFHYKADEPSANAPDAIDQLDPEFVRKFANILAKHNLTGTLGLRLVRKEIDFKRIEFTEGNVNITMSYTEAMAQTIPGQHIEAAWHYVTDGIDGVDAKHHCPLYCLDYFPGSHCQSHYVDLVTT